MELITALMAENLSLRKEIAALKESVPAKPVKIKKIKETDLEKPKKKYGKLDDETLAAKRRENGLKLAAWRKAEKEKLVDSAIEDSE